MDALGESWAAAAAATVAALSKPRLLRRDWKERSLRQRREIGEMRSTLKEERKDMLRMASKVLVASTFEDEVGDVSCLVDRAEAERP